jgi:predicted nucleic acid-binding Zn ribbon protein
VKHCTICNKELEPDQVKFLYSANYCSEYCKKEAGRRYDAYVDPLGYYTAKAEFGDEYD